MCGVTKRNPRGGIDVRLSPTVGVSVSAGRYHQQPELVAVVAVAENGNLAPIEADHVVAGVKYEPRAELLMAAEVYRKWSSPVVVYAPVESIRMTAEGTGRCVARSRTIPSIQPSSGGADRAGQFVQRGLLEPVSTQYPQLTPPVLPTVEK
jgi:hypothetical protein